MSLTVPAGTELHLCQFATLPTTTDVEATAFSHRYTPGSHHFVVIATDLDTAPADMPGQYDCTNGNEPVLAHGKGVLYGGQTPIGNFPLPSGVGFNFRPRQVVILQTHYLNTGATALDAKVEFGIDLAAPGTIKQEAGFMFFYDPFVYLPAGGTSMTGLGCKVPNDITVISASTHYHQRGTGMRVWNDVGGTPSASPFFETHDWEHPVDFHGPLAVASGSRLRFECEYKNPEAQEIFEGPNAKTSEMCVFGGLYYPKQDPAFDHCEEPTVQSGGAKTCSDQVTCLQSCPGGERLSGPCFQRCIGSGCAGATDALVPLIGCAQQKCQEECGAGHCSDCAAAKCADVLQPCVSHTCAH